MIKEPLYSHGPNHKFGQYPMSQNQLALPMLSMALDYENPTVVIEVGTQQGGLVCGLTELDVRGMQFISVDITDQRTDEVKDSFLRHGITFELGDCFSVVPRLMKRFEKNKVVILCDGGDKNKEMKLFRPLCKPGDVIAAHDWTYAVNARVEKDGNNFWAWSEFNFDLRTDLFDPEQENFEYPWYAKQLSFAAWFCQVRKQL